jgi:hypothetical protein
LLAQKKIKDVRAVGYQSSKAILPPNLALSHVQPCRAAARKHGLHLLMYLTGKMEFNIRIIGSFCIEKPFALCQVYFIAIFIECGIGHFKPNKVFKFFSILTGNPAGFIKRQRVELYRCALLL